MKHTILLCLFLLHSVLSTALLAENSISIIFTHDMHSHFEPEVFVDNCTLAERGGFARIKTTIDTIKQKYPDSLVLDAGDFSMGTAFQTIFSTDAPELRLMGQMGFDATTLGNHEFDYRAQGLTSMLESALVSVADTNIVLPSLVIANIDWEKTLNDSEKKCDALSLQNTLKKYNYKDYIIINKNGLKIAIFGIMGKESDAYAPHSGLYFLDPIERSKEIINEIKKEGVDFIICLSHSGTNKDAKKSEDELLAKAVQDIDVIISGHTHTLLKNPLIHGKTHIVSLGAYTHKLGHLTFTGQKDTWNMQSYNLIDINNSINENIDITLAIDNFRKNVDAQYFKQFDYEYNKIIAQSDFSFKPIEQFGLQQGEEPLGNLIADSYKYSVKKAEGEQYKPIDVSVVPYGVIRASFVSGDITTAQAFTVSSLGIGDDKIPGYPLVSIYVTGSELKTLAEIDISISNLMIESRLYSNGLTYTYNPHRLFLNKVTDVKIVREDGKHEKIDKKRLYRVIADLYSCQMLGEVESQSFGLLKIIPKDQHGNPLINYEDHIIYNDTDELKEWYSLAQYLESFPKNKENNISQIPHYYKRIHGRKVEVDSYNPIELLKNPNKYFFLFIGIILLGIVIIIFVIKLLQWIINNFIKFIQCIRNS